MLSLLAVAILTGCETMPPPEAVLEGAWKVVKDSESGGQNKMVVVLNDRGQVTSVATTTGGVTITQDNATGTATLDGLNITIRTSTNLLFKGAFDEDLTQAEGKQYTEFTILGVTTTIDEGDATLTRDN